MTQEQWKLLIAEKKVTPIAAVAEEAKVMVEPSPQVSEMAASPQPPTTEEENPFAFSDNETNAVDATLRAIDPDPSRLPLIANNESPKAYAALFSVAAWIEQEGQRELAELDRSIGNYLLMFGCSRRGKENRITKVLETLKAVYQQQLDEAQFDKKSRLLGR